MTQYTVLIAMCGIPNIFTPAGVGLLLARHSRGSVLPSIANRLIALSCLGLTLVGDGVVWVGIACMSYVTVLLGSFIFR